VKVQTPARARTTAAAIPIHALLAFALIGLIGSFAFSEYEAGRTGDWFSNGLLEAVGAGGGGGRSFFLAATSAVGAIEVGLSALERMPEGDGGGGGGGAAREDAAFTASRGGGGGVQVSGCFPDGFDPGGGGGVHAIVLHLPFF